MKIRTDFVTNSSSASYVVELQLRSEDGGDVTYRIATGGYPSEYEGQDAYEVLFKWGWPIKALDFSFPHYMGCKSLEDYISTVLGSIEVTPYPEGIILDQMRFFIVGEPSRYRSRDQLEDVIRRNGGEVADSVLRTDFVILCGEYKKRFCERWPYGYSTEAMDDAELDELYAAEDVIDDEIYKALRATEDGSVTVGLFTGASEEFSDMGRDDWQGWTLCDWIGDPMPVLSEEEFAFFDPDGPAGEGGLSAIPGAVEALMKKCADAGITMENLLTVSALFSVYPFGDSWREVEPRCARWFMNLHTGEFKRTDEQDW